MQTRGDFECYRDSAARKSEYGHVIPVREMLKLCGEEAACLVPVFE